MTSFRCLFFFFFHNRSFFFFFLCVRVVFFVLSEEMATRLWLLLLGVLVLLGTSTGCRAADMESDLALVQTLFDQHGIRDAVRCNTSRITCALNETGGDYVRELSVHRTHAHPLHAHTRSS